MNRVPDWRDIVAATRPERSAALAALVVQDDPVGTALAQLEYVTGGTDALAAALLEAARRNTLPGWAGPNGAAALRSVLDDVDSGRWVP